MPVENGHISLFLRCDPETPGLLLLSTPSSDDQEDVGSYKPDDQTPSQRRGQIPDEVSICLNINEPRTLLYLGKEMASGKQHLTVTDTRKPPNSSTEAFNLEIVSIQMLQIAIFAPISPGELSPTELNGGVDGPAMSSLIHAWREAFSSIPNNHSIRRVQFDMFCREAHEPRHIVRLLQEVSTVLYMKAGVDVRRVMVFEVTGCGREKIEWLEASLPGGRAR